MTTWLAPKKAAKYIKEKNPNTMIREKTIRTLIANGFPHIKVESRFLINMDTFDKDLEEYSKAQTLKNVNESTQNIQKKK